MTSQVNGGGGKRKEESDEREREREKRGGGWGCMCEWLQGIWPESMAATVRRKTNDSRDREGRRKRYAPWGDVAAVRRRKRKIHNTKRCRGEDRL